MVARENEDRSRRRITIVLARCSKTREPFAIRFEPRGSDQWTATWTFAIRESSARREGYEGQEIAGSFDFDPAYPGCPHCHGRQIFRCACAERGRVGCWNGKENSVTCPWCGRTSRLEGQIDRLGSRGDA